MASSLAFGIVSLTQRQDLVRMQTVQEIPETNIGLARSLRDVLDSLRVYGKSAPWIFYPVARLKYHKRHLLVTPDTDVVIEGFPRCANTFAVQAFLSCQRKPVKVAHHYHAAAQIRLGVQWKIPTIVLIRKPKDAVMSYLIYESGNSAASCLKEYMRFYTAIFHYRESFITAEFGEVVNRFGDVMDRLNQTFYTNFDIFEHTKENVDLVFAQMEGIAAELGQGAKRVARPDRDRDALKAWAQDQVSKPEAYRLLSRARELYWQFLGGG